MNGRICRPGTLAEAVTILLVNVDASGLVAWADRPIREARAAPPAGLVAWIHARWIEAEGTSLAARIGRLGGDVTVWVLDSLWGVLNGKPCPTVETMAESAEPRGRSGAKPRPHEPL